LKDENMKRNSSKFNLLNDLQPHGTQNYTICIYMFFRRTPFHLFAVGFFLETFFSIITYRRITEFPKKTHR